MPKEYDEMAWPSARLQVPPDPKIHHSDREDPVEEPFDSYASNRLCLLIDGQQLWLEPVKIKPDEPAGESEIPEQLAAFESLTYISAWNPDGDRSTFGQNSARHAELRDFIEQLGLEYVEAVAVAQTGEWFEEGLAVIGIDADIAHDLAWKCDQPATIRIDQAGWHVQPRYSSDGARRLQFRAALRPTGHCPVRKFDAEVEKCTPQGGHYVSASRRKMLIWKSHYAIGVSLLGCGVCGDGKRGPRIPQIIAPREVCVSSRFGGYCFGGRVDYEWTQMSRVLTAEGWPAGEGDSELSDDSEKMGEL